MDYRLQDLIDIPLFQALQDRLDQIYSFPAAIIDNDGNVLTATAWQDICTRFHRAHPECAQECRASDLYILDHLGEAKPAVTYRCPHGLVDNATPIVIGGRHLGNYFTGQFFLEPPDLDFFRRQAARYGFDEDAYLAAVAKVPVWSEAKLHQYLDFIKGFVEILAGIGLRQLQTREAQRLMAEQGNDPGSAGLMARQIIDSADEGIIVYGPDLHYRVWNPYMERMTGVSASGVLGRHPLEVFPFLAGVGVLDRVARALQGQRMPPLDLAFGLPNGRTGWSVDTTVPLFAENGAIVGALASVVDTTDRHHIEAELQARESELKDLVESSSDRVWAIDGAGRHTFVNTAVRELLGCEPADLIGQPASALMHPDDAARWQAQVAEWARLGQGWRHQRMRWVHRNGDTRTFESSANPIFGPDGEVVGFRGIDRDITEQLQAQSDYEGLFNEMLDGFAVHEILCDETGRPVDYRFLAVNPAFERLTGLKAKAVVGRTAREVLPGLEREWLDRYGRVALTGEPTHFEQRAASLGKVFEVRAFSPRPRRFACVVVDTTERVEAEARRRQSEARQQAMLAPICLYWLRHLDTEVY